jgi:hypothetical protein
VQAAVPVSFPPATGRVLVQFSSRLSIDSFKLQAQLKEIGPQKIQLQAKNYRVDARDIRSRSPPSRTFNGCSPRSSRLLELGVAIKSRKRGVLARVGAIISRIKLHQQSERFSSRNLKGAVTLKAVSMRSTTTKGKTFTEWWTTTMNDEEIIDEAGMKYLLKNQADATYNDIVSSIVPECDKPRKPPCRKTLSHDVQPRARIFGVSAGSCF